MCDQYTPQPVYVETVGLATAQVYHHKGVYSLFLVGDQVACFLGNATSLHDCQEEIKSLKELSRDLVESPVVL